MYVMFTSQQHPQPQILDRNAFAERVQQYLSTHTGVTISHRTDQELTLHLGGAPVRVQLAPAYDTYVHDPTQLLPLLQAMVTSVQKFRPNQLITDFAVLRNTVYPMLKSLELLVAVRERKLPMLVYQLFPADLIITYVVDAGNSVTYINEQHLDCWQVDPQTLHIQALKNLRQRTADIRYTTVGDGAHRLFLFNTQDGYDATRLLLPELLTPWRSSLPERMVLGIPNRDLLVAFSDSDRTTFMKVLHQIQLDMVQHPAGLTDQLFTLIGTHIERYTWE